MWQLLKSLAMLFFFLFLVCMSHSIKNAFEELVQEKSWKPIREYVTKGPLFWYDPTEFPEIMKTSEKDPDRYD